MFEFLNNLFVLGSITAEKVWSYCPRFITAEEATQIAGEKPAAKKAK